VCRFDIKRAQPGDFLAIAALDRVVWQKSRHPEFIPDGEHVWRVWVEHALVYVAWEESRLLGAVLAFPCVDGTFCVHKVFVREDARGRGVATRLFGAILEQLDRLAVDVFLTVDPANTAAQKLYAQWGLTERRLVRGYYRRQEDRLILTRRHGSLSQSASARQTPSTPTAQGPACPTQTRCRR